MPSTTDDILFSIPQDLIQEAVNTFGADHQIMILFEEMSELQKSLCKHLRGSHERYAIVEEIADVYIMLEQLLTALDCKGEVATVIPFKCEKLQHHITEYRETGKEPV